MARNQGILEEGRERFEGALKDMERDWKRLTKRADQGRRRTLRGLSSAASRKAPRNDIRQPESWPTRSVHARTQGLADDPNGPASHDDQ